MYRLVLTVHFHAPRYHGRPEWPPSPARLFQAVVAGVGPRLDEAALDALRWWEGKPPPVIAAPRQRPGAVLTRFVPNNDLDAKKGDPSLVAEIRVGKSEQPRLLDPGSPLIYAWEVDDPDQARRIVALAQHLYQLGRGIDPAWAQAQLMEADQAEALLGAHDGTVHRPTAGSGGEHVLPCPVPGTLDSLLRRHQAQGERFAVEGRGRSAVRLFRQPPKAFLRQVAYDAPATTFEYVLHAVDRETGAVDAKTMASVPVGGVVGLVEAARDGAADRLRQALGDSPQLHGALVGRRPGEPRVVATEHRVRILPLPTIGHRHADGAIRRLLVEVPQAAPLRADDVAWAFDGLELHLGQASVVLVPAIDPRMSRRYRQASREWRSITPVALPQQVARRRIDPDAGPPKGGPERLDEEGRARAAVATALRHAGVSAELRQVQVQREPLGQPGSRAEHFHHPPRFSKHRLWHVAIELDREIPGPLALGDGRFLGLGVMVPRPSSNAAPAFAWTVEGLTDQATADGLARALRRATLARAQAAWGQGKPLPTVVSGHKPDGSPAEKNAHLAFHWDPPRQRLLVLLPPQAGPKVRERLRRAFDGFHELRAGPCGLLTLSSAPVDLDDPLFRTSQTWVSVTPYRVQRHRKRTAAEQVLVADLQRAAADAQLPRPQVVEVADLHGVSGRGLQGRVRLRFPSSVTGPVALGRSRFLGGGLFAAAD